MHRALVRNVGIRTNKVVPGNFYVLRSSAAPALLTETSYLTNPDVEERLRLPEKQELEAQALFVGLARYFARKLPVIEEFAVFRPADSSGSPFERGVPRPAGHGGRCLRPRPHDRGWAARSLRCGRAPDSSWSPPAPLAGGPHRATLRVALSGEGSSRERSLEFGVALALGSISASFPDQVGWDGRQPLGAGGARARRGGLALHRLRDRARAGPRQRRARARRYHRDDARRRDLGLLPRRAGPRPDRSRRGQSTSPPRRGNLDLEIEAYSSTLTPDGHSPQFATRAGIGVGDEPAAPFRTAFALRMPEGAPLRDAPGTGGPAPALRWINRDGFVRLPRDPAGAVHVPALPGYRAWPADSSLPAPLRRDLPAARCTARRIVLDPEGGGEDAAGQGPGGTRAASLNLESARILAGFLAAAGADVRLTREGDLALSDVERVQTSEAFQAERFLRIAHRAAPPRLGHHAASPAGRAWAERSAQALAALGLAAPEVTEEAQYVIQQTSCPALFASPASLGDEASEARLLAPGALRAEAYALFLALAREWAPRGGLAGRLAHPARPRGAPRAGRGRDPGRRARPRDGRVRPHPLRPHRAGAYRGRGGGFAGPFPRNPDRIAAGCSADRDARPLTRRPPREPYHVARQPSSTSSSAPASRAASRSSARA